MSQPHVITALVKKHSEIEGEIASLQDQIQSLTKQKSHISQTIKIFDPDYDLRTIKATQPHTKSAIFEHGECNRLVLSYLRDSNTPPSTDDITDHIITHKNIPETEQAIARQAIKKTLYKKKEQGVLIKNPQGEWEVAA